MAKRIVQSLDFSKEGHHVALVPKAANGESVLIMKAKETMLEKQDVRIEMPMHEFLYKFYDMWYGDAVELSKLLGYESQENMEEDFGISMTLLKSVKDLSTMPDVIFSQIDALQKKFGEKLITNGTQIMTTEVKKEDVDLKKKLEDMEVAMAKAKATSDAQEVELQELRKQREKAEESAFVELVKGYSFAGEDDERVKLVEALYKGRAIQGFDVILSALEKANKALDEVVLKEKGHGESVDLASLPAYAGLVTDILKNRK